MDCLPNLNCMLAKKPNYRQYKPAYFTNNGGSERRLRLIHLAQIADRNGD
jgi:hypothetical protein